MNQTTIDRRRYHVPMDLCGTTGVRVEFDGVSVRITSDLGAEDREDIRISERALAEDASTRVSLDEFKREFGLD